MPFEQVSEYIKLLANTPSNNDREYLLEDYLKDSVFVKTAKYALSQGWTYNIGDIPLHSKPLNLADADELFEYLDYLREKGSANNDDKIQLSRLCSASEATLHVANCIVKKDLRCGCGVKTINKVKPKTAWLVPYQRCTSYSEKALAKIQCPAVVQKKADSMFSYLLPFRETGKFLTRGGLYYDINSNILQKEAKALIDGKEVLVGEAQVMDKDWNNVLNRKTGNGILNSIIQGTGTQEQMDRVIYDVWDIIPYDEWLAEYYPVNIIHRFKTICEREKRIRGDAIQVIPYEYVDSIEEAMDFYYKMRDLGYEGAILKNFSDHWKFNTSTKQVKLKNQSEAEFLIVDAYYGKKGHKNEHLLGGLTIESSCGGIRSNCGGGFSKNERELGVDWWLENRVGQIGSFHFESVIADKTDRKTMKLYSAQWIEHRHDKIEADTMQYCIDISTGKIPNKPKRK